MIRYEILNIEDLQRNSRKVLSKVSLITRRGKRGESLWETFFNLTRSNRTNKLE